MIQVFNSKAEKQSSLFVNFMIFILIYFSFDSGINGLRWSKEVAVFTGFACAIVLFTVRIFEKKTHYSFTSLVVTLLIFSVNLFNFILFNDFAPNNIILLSSVVVGYLISVSLDFREFKISYLNSMVFLCLYSIVATYVFLPLIMRGHLMFFPTTYNMFGVPMSDMYFSFGIKYFGLIRNQGLFREPGIFQIFILVALLLSLYQQEDRRKNKRIFLFILTMLTTFSAVGIVLMVIVLAVYYFPNFFKHPGRVLCGLILLAITIQLLLRFVPSFQTELLRSLAKWDAGSSSSFAMRFDSLINTLRLSFSYPITGMSFERAIIYIIEHFNVGGSRDVAATTLLIFSCMGIPMGLLLHGLLWGFARRISNQTFQVLISSFLVLFISINSQNILCNSFFWVFLFLPFMQETQTELPVDNPTCDSKYVR